MKFHEGGQTRQHTETTGTFLQILQTNYEGKFQGMWTHLGVLCSWFRASFIYIKPYPANVENMVSS